MGSLHRSIPRQLALAAAALAASAWLAGAGAPPRADPQARRHGIMRPDLPTLDRWEAHRQAAVSRAPARGLAAEARAAAAPPATFSLLPLVPSPALRDQGDCGSCWVWASTGMAEVALNAQYGLQDRLSVEYFQANETGAWACDAGDLTEFCDWYDNAPGAALGANAHPGVMVPWSNAGGAYADGAVTQYQFESTVPPGAVGLQPCYSGLTLNHATLATTGVSQAAAITAIQTAIAGNQAVGFSFYTNFGAAGTGFDAFWDGQPEAALWTNAYEGGTWHSSDLNWGGHMVMIVGYDTTASPPCWILQNQWGTVPGLRPNGLFRMPMAMNYGATYTYVNTTTGASRSFPCYGFETLTLATPGSASPAGTPAAPAGALTAAPGPALAGQLFEVLPAFTAGSPPFTYQWSVTYDAGLQTVTPGSASAALSLPNDAAAQYGVLDSGWDGATVSLAVTNGSGSATLGPFTLAVAGSVLNPDSGFEATSPAAGWTWLDTALLTGEGLPAGNAGTLTSLPVTLPANAATPVYATYYLQMVTRETLPMVRATCTLQVVDPQGKVLQVLKTHTNMDVDHLAYLPETFALTALNPGGAQVALQAVWSDPDAATAFRLDNVQILADAGSAQPALTAFTPTHGAPGATVTLTGSHFTGATGVLFGRTHANSVTGVSDTQLQAVVPWDGATGPITVAGPAGTVSSGAPFFVAPSFITDPASYGYRFGSTLADMTPATGAPYSTVRLAGLNFTGATAVTVGGVAAPFTVDSNTQITLSIPVGVAQGPIAVTAPGGKATTAGDFTVVGTAPTLTVTPASATAGSLVTLTGAGFLTATSVTFNHLPAAAFTVASDTSLTAQVPSGPSSGTVAVVTAGGTATAAFTVLAPSLAPAPAAIAGSGLAVTGSGFLDATSLTFNGTAIKGFTISDNSHLAFLVPTLPKSGSYALAVTSPEGTSPAVAVAVTVPPVPASAAFTPTSGPVGTTVTVKGQFLTGTTAVTLNGVGAPFSVLSDTLLTFTVPATASAGTVAVTTASGTWTSTATFYVNIQVVMLASPDGLLTGAAFPFQAAVRGDPSASVVWSLQEGLLGGTVNAKGVYTAPGQAGLYHVVATSALDSTASATAAVQVHGPAISAGASATQSATVADLACLMAAYGSKAGEALFNPLADLNGDGVINDLDLALFLEAF